MFLWCLWAFFFCLFGVFLGFFFLFGSLALFGFGVFFVPFVCSLSCPRSFLAY